MTRKAAPSISAIRGSDCGYLAFHAPRYRYILTLTTHHPLPAAARVLDIGASPLTALLREHLGRPIDTLGLEPDSSAHGDRHFHFDLNTLRDPRAPRPDLQRYHLIVMAEVLEHLYAPPVPVLQFLHNLLVDGGVLILQTPNAASLGKRIKLLAGRHPYELIRDDATNPGHFREYTIAELRTICERSGLAPVTLSRRFYFDARFARHGQDGQAGVPQPLLGTAKNVLYRALPPFLREGITLVLRRA